MDQIISSADISHECDTLSIFKLNQLDPRRHTQFILLKSIARSELRCVRPRMHRIAAAVHAWFRAPGVAGRGGASRDRTGDLLLAKQALSQLSYGPAVRYPSKGGKWWAWEDLNFRPHAYQARALTN